MKKVSFDHFFKVALLVFIGYFLALVTVLTFRKDSISEIGRYQFHPTYWKAIDTKTGAIIDLPRK